MPKLYFRYGAMNSSKTANLLMVAHNYQSQGKKVLLIKPNIDDRFGKNIIKSRSGIEKEANYLLDKEDYNLREIDGSILEKTDAILVDEVQFLTTEQINTLRELAKFCPVICYGLRSDYKSQLFEGSKRLMEIADSIEEIKTICNFCNKKAIMNMKYAIVNGIEKSIKNGSDNPELGAEDKYLGVCWECWNKF
jgi:thymidine kinase